MRRWLAGLSLLALLAACGPDAGTVTGKKFKAGYTWIQHTQSCRTVGKSTSCSPIIIVHNVPDCWEIQIRAENGDKGSRCVSEKEYDSYRVGDWYPKGEK